MGRLFWEQDTGRFDSCLPDVTTGFDDTYAVLDGFIPGQQIYVVEKKVVDGVGEMDGYTYVCLTYMSEDDGVRFTYVDDGTTYRVFLPTHMIRRIYQVA